MSEIYVGSFRVDIARSQLHIDTDIITLEPKVMQVLLFLAKQQGEVVSHQALLDEIWPDTLADSSSLQRCIAQLRKAFGDSAKKQTVIATFPKSGYSLLLPVRWHEKDKTGVDHLSFLSRINNHIIKTFSSTSLSSRYLATAAFLLTIFGIYLSSEDLDTESSKPYQADLSTTKNLEFTDATKHNQSDFYAVYSPDGLYVAYPRFNQGRLGHLWVQNLATGEETQITITPGYFEYAAWSPDSQRLAFVESNCTDEGCRSVDCSALNLLDFPLPISTTSVSQTLIPCRSMQLQSPEWLSLNEIALIERSEQRSTIIKFGVDHLSRQVLYQQTGKSPYHLTYSEHAKKLAITLSNTSAQQELLLLATDTGNVSRLSIALPDSGADEPWYPSWNPQSTALLISSLSGVFTIGLDGSVSKQVYPFLP